ncbi:class I SAM-dependent methyltransferase [Neorhodopirellula pilleata]|uniref:Putative S-adenosyl-L-methionine-dependent methyltransferase n=1 Tax=Neorhodopirellula pilleata TaxID=2714738 RepID=A0A5C6AWM6_9BACT|nr:putative S-adenosyl-L-methionine-dependent methyltransferase [Neorhodopirellula pilleata]
MAAADAPLCRIVSDAELADPLRTVDSIGWLGGSIQGWKVLCLAGGGGRQSCLYAAAGAHVTVVDLSPAMLELDREAARKRGYSVRLIEGSMDDLSMLAGADFDLVVHPVSTCYLPDIVVVYQQVATVLRDGGLYISQHKSPVSLQTSIDRPSGRYAIDHAYYRSAPVPDPKISSSVANRLREPGATEFLHRWEDMIGGLCRSGFVIEDLIEPMHADPKASPNSFADRANYVPPYVRIKARRRQADRTFRSERAGTLWLPDS